MIRQVVFAILFVCSSAATASATVVNAGSGGLVAPTNTISFDGAPLVPGVAVTTQFAADGITFTGAGGVGTGAYFRGPFGCGGISNMNIDCVTNLQSLGSLTPLFTEIHFSGPVTDLIMNVGGLQLTVVMRAFLDGALVDQFSFLNQYGFQTNYYGFIDSTFDMVQLQLSTITQEMFIDNIQFNLASTVSVAEPGAIIIFSTTVCVIGLRCRRKTTE